MNKIDNLFQSSKSFTIMNDLCSCVDFVDCSSSDCHSDMNMAPLNSSLYEANSFSRQVLSVPSIKSRSKISAVVWLLSASLVMIPVWAWSENPYPNRMNYLPRLTSTDMDLQMYIQPHGGENSHTGPWIGQVFFKTERNRKSALFYNSRRKRIYVPSHGKKQSLLKFSRSILTPMDTLPSFSTAHGLLSPETVMRMDFMTQGSRSEPLEHFFQHYRRNGPMACLPFLSDMSVLPHLTEALRDVTSN